MDTGDYVVVVNARHAQFTGKKFEQKYYKWHTGFVGGLKVCNSCIIILILYSKYIYLKFHIAAIKSTHTSLTLIIQKMSVKRMLEKNPTKVLHHAIMGMIPKNRLKSVREKKLKLYAGTWRGRERERERM